LDGRRDLLSDIRGMIKGVNQSGHRRQYQLLHIAEELVRALPDPLVVVQTLDFAPWFCLSSASISCASFLNFPTMLFISS